MGIIDLNSDLGEGFGAWPLGDDAAMLSLVTSANIACGFHAGDPSTLLAATGRALDGAVRVGAQVGYRDLPGFGRRFIDYAPAELTAEIIYQIGALDGLARTRGGRVGYVKPHGALYNAIVHHRAQAQAVVDAVRAYDPGLPVLGLPGSEFLAAAERAGLPTVPEAFADRAYTPQGTLVPRSAPGAVLSDGDAVAERAVALAVDGTVRAVDGSVIAVRARSLCVHGDTPGAVALARRVRDGLVRAGVAVRPFT